MWNRLVFFVCIYYQIYMYTLTKDAYTVYYTSNTMMLQLYTVKKTCPGG